MSDCCQFINKEASQELINTTLAISVNIEYIAPAGTPSYLFTNSDAPTSWKQANMVVQQKNIKTDKHPAENPSLPFFNVIIKVKNTIIHILEIPTGSKS